MLGFFSFLVLATLCVIYLGKSFSGKNALLDKVNSILAPHMDKLPMVALAYGLFASFVTPMAVLNGTDMMIRLAANVLIVLMALPYVFDKLIANYQEKINAAVLEELRHLVDWSNRNAKTVTYVALFVGVLLFATLLR